MPIHDWTRVGAGTWHDFHLAWISEIRNALNDGRMPNDYYAQAEQIIGPLGPDVLTLQESHDSSFDQIETTPSANTNYGGILVTSSPPQMRMSAQAEMNDYVLKRRTLVINAGYLLRRFDQTSVHRTNRRSSRFDRYATFLAPRVLCPGSPGRNLPQSLSRRCASLARSFGSKSGLTSFRR